MQVVLREAGLALLLSVALLSTALRPATLGADGQVAPQAPPQTQAAPASAEAPPIPPEGQQLLALWESRLENASLRVALAQTQLELVRREAEAALATLQREGYTLSRGDNGVWAYTKAAPR